MDKRTLVARYDSSDITDGEVEHILENLGEYPEKARDIVGWIYDLEGYEAIEKLVDAGKYDEASKAIRENSSMLDVARDKLTERMWDDPFIYQMIFDDELTCMDDEWKSSPFCGVYSRSDEYPWDWVMYQSCSELVRKILERDNRSEDFEVWREADGVLSIKAHCQRYNFVPIEVGLKYMVGKCVVDDEGEIFRIKKISGVDNGYMEFDAYQYDHQERRFSDKSNPISERYLAKNHREEIRTMLLIDAIRYRRAFLMMENLRRLGVAA